MSTGKYLKIGAENGLRKFQRRQILSRFADLERLLTEGSFADCLRVAGETAGIIESAAGAGTRTGALLKECCDLLSDTAADKTSGKYLKYLRKCLTKTVNSANGEFKSARIEAAFFPYTMAMADSLESIYFAAKEDPDCEAYWVPIPYYDCNPDRTLGKMHCDGGQYPARFEAVAWQEYDVKARHPDIVFIHNPYDDRNLMNLITCVHSDYYAYALKKHTDCLCFVSYGIQWFEVKTPARFQGREDLIPYYLNLCRTVDIYNGWWGEHNLAQAKFLFDAYGGGRELDKLVAFGSPKFDKVINDKRENYELPEEWRGLICGAGGTRKKVMLFNITLKIVFENPAENADLDSRLTAWFKRLTDTLEVFERHKDTIVLWLRPHPFLMSGFSSMQEGYARQYEEIIEKYKADGFGVYDDTADLHRAIAWSDGYYGSESSVHFLYLATGKPLTLNDDFPAEWENVHYTRNTGTDFTDVIQSRIANMRAAPGGNICGWNMCINWHIFREKTMHPGWQFTEYENFLERYIHYLVHIEEYPDAETYKELSLRMFREFVKNPDGTAGQKLYEYCKEKVTRI